ncbi:hypothetical protein J437_LFUL008823 [Ladona fulva]|uniref:Methyltransferase FkbM domain-containing protein n=1 Tax=Ladona fulva TaxID=123851 RepID=A0A8K0P1K2_LADFU|nr:hypothetical protein J437_LFUL008823 [Ladona fulva]
MLRRNLVVICFTCLLFFTALLYIQYLVGDGNILVPFPWKEDPYRKYRTKEYQESLLKWYNYSDGNVIFNGPSTKMDDPMLISSIRSRFLIPPSIQPYNLKEPEVLDPSMGQSSWIRKILKNQRNGFFVEAGALDGETRSNTLFLEKELGWRGLLVEADPYNFAHLVKRNRKAWSTPTCLSTQPYPMMVSFKQEENMGKISDRQVGSPLPGYVDVQCFPFYSLLLAMNVTTVDYFSLDVEGSELEVLQTIPFDKVDIKTLSVEFIHGPLGKEALREWMERKGYKVVAEVTHHNWWANDFIFVKNSIAWSIKGDEVR